MLVICRQVAIVTSSIGDACPGKTDVSIAIVGGLELPGDGSVVASGPRFLGLWLGVGIGVTLRSRRCGARGPKLAEVPFPALRGVEADGDGALRGDEFGGDESLRFSIKALGPFSYVGSSAPPLVALVVAFVALEISRSVDDMARTSLSRDYG